MRPATEVADVVEIRTWAANKIYTIGALKEDLEALLSDGEEGEPELYAQQVFDELAARAQRLGSAYPFTFDGHMLRPKAVATGGSSYLFCLGLSLLKPQHITPNIRNVEFETLVMRAAQKYFGGEAVRIGAPWKTTDIQKYTGLLKIITDLIPDLGQPTRSRAPQGGDGGWDVVIVKNFGDRQFPRLIALGNCATGKTDWRRKGAETEPTYFWSFFSHGHRSVCVTFLAAPFVMDEDDRLRKSGTTTLAFDRMRICEYAADASEAVQTWLDGNREHLLTISLT